MYLALKHSHLLTAALSIFLTGVWTVLAWNGSRRTSGGLGGQAKVTYIAHRIVSGLAGLTGLAVTAVGPWHAMLFPYIGLAAFVVHGIAANISKKTFDAAHEARKRRVALLIQIAALVLSAYAMVSKPI
ncbi:hypothetical protein AzCIB_2484 [Azoarcus sp. CIB]|uniref:hypothetical protein n=1 Tax=Aromatoleum sp. (strain CIB) TaxID=198107 RepID=UPI0006A26D74|nr:hypothetical protein [Azoarcus sp. CIB]AKU12377.1 hypothetical protein AzCIB_2484 [Azoarcus sp. CIB]